MNTEQIRTADANQNYSSDNDWPLERLEKELVPVAQISELTDGQFKKITVNGQALIIAKARGLIYALADECSHEDYPLSYGCIHGDTIKCSLHGSRFDLLTGFPLDEPAELPVPVYRVVVGFNRIWIDPRQPVDPEEYYHEVKGY